MPWNSKTQHFEYEGPEPYEKCFGVEVAGYINDNGDGFIHVEPGDGFEYRVEYVYGCVARCTKFGLDSRARYWESLKSE